MTLTVEDGTGLENANSYADVAEGDAYFADRPTQNAVWSVKTVEEREETLILATSYLDAQYGGKWIGRKNERDNALDWPRADAVTLDLYTMPADEVPARLKRATFEAAFLSAPVGTVTLLPTVTSPATGIRSTKRKADVVEETIVYSGSGAEQTPLFTAITGLLNELIGARGSGGVRVRG